MKIISYKSVDSTNLEAQRLLNSQEKIPFVVVSEKQTSGKGRGEHIWETESGKNLMCSFVIEPGIHPQYQYLITVAISVSIFQLLQKYLSPDNQIKIKWPNDIYVDDNKICGILISNKIFGDEIKSSIIGSGINVNQIDFPAHLSHATSIKKITKDDMSINELLRDLIDLASENFKIMQSNPAKLISIYTENLYKLNKPAMYNIDGKLVELCITGIDEFGGII
ncbi:MAG: biotin--[acetyl-CoA-carboxylase] ligase [Bacteroidales bacterium]|jgi:BirA family biotin operon repressor/biotin-[acetyl-CoA-carboxylase] ligase|nr:biotin--[acetyl-CoA-carboxylase] ligase [Bacteroidales bacterium]